MCANCSFCAQGYMEAMSKICDGVFMKPEKITDLCHYFQVQVYVCKLFFLCSGLHGGHVQDLRRCVHEA